MAPTDSERIQQLEAKVARFESRLAQLEGRPSHPVQIKPGTVPPPPPPPAYHSKTKYVEARWAAGLGGLLALFFTGLFPPAGVLGFLGILLALIWPWNEKITPAAPAAPGGTPVAPPRPVKKAPSAFEQDLARHWFSWLGIITLVVGISLFLNYALRGYGPLGNVLTAYAVAAMLFGLWAWFRRQYHSFAMILQSGAWAVAYLATYALHGFEQAVLPSALAGGSFLLALVGIMVVAAVVQKSKELTAGAFLLGFVAAVTSPVETFTLTALVLLAAGLVIVTTRFHWTSLAVIGNALAYLSFFVWWISRPEMQATVPTAVGFLILIAVIFGLGHWLTPVAPEKKPLPDVASGAATNLAGFFLLFHFLVLASYNDRAWIATLFLAAVAGLLAGLTRIVPNRNALRPVYTVFAVVFLTIGIAERFHDASLATLWILESGIITLLGILNRSVLLRWCGFAVTVVATFGTILALEAGGNFGQTEIPIRIVLGLLGLLVYGLVAWFARQHRDQLTQNERQIAAVYTDLGALISVVAFGAEWTPSWVVGVWGVLGLALIGIGSAWRSLNGVLAGLLLLVITVLYWIANLAPSAALAGSLPLTGRLVSGTWLLMVISLSAWITAVYKTKLATLTSISIWLGWLAIGFGTWLIGAESSTRLLSVWWAIEGICIFIYGFARKSSTARRQGLAVLILTIGKVYLYDIQTLDTGYRIASFLILGVILLGIGYLYNRWRQNQPKA